MVLFKSPTCCLSAKDFSTKGLRLPLLSPSAKIDAKYDDEAGVYVGTFDLMGMPTWMWMHPWKQTDGSKERVEMWFNPGWFVDVTKDTELVNMEVVWKKLGHVHVPSLVNNCPLKRGMQLYRLAYPKMGTCPDEVKKAIDKIYKKAEKEKKEAEEKAAAEKAAQVQAAQAKKRRASKEAEEAAPGKGKKQKS